MAAGTKITEDMALKMNKGKEFDLLNQKMGNASALIGQAFAPAALKLGNTIGSVVDKVSGWESTDRSRLITFEIRLNRTRVRCFILDC